MEVCKLELVPACPPLAWRAEAVRAFWKKDACATARPVAVSGQGKGGADVVGVTKEGRSRDLEVRG